MAFFTSIFRNLKNGGAVGYEKPSRFHQWLIDNPGGVRQNIPRGPPQPIAKKEGGEVKSQFWQLFEKANKPLTAPIRKKDGGEVPEKSFSFSRFKEALSKHSFSPIPKAPIRMQEGGVVEARTPFQQAIHNLSMQIAGGGGIRRNIQRKAPIAKKKGGRVKKTKPIAKKSKTKKQKK